MNPSVMRKITLIDDVGGLIIVMSGNLFGVLQRR